MLYKISIDIKEIDPFVIIVLHDGKMRIQGIYQVLIESLTFLLLSSLYTMGFDISAK
jgi:hypothetical protein